MSVTVDYRSGMVFGWQKTMMSTATPDPSITADQVVTHRANSLGGVNQIMCILNLYSCLGEVPTTIEAIQAPREADIPAITLHPRHLGEALIIIKEGEEEDLG